MTIREQAFEQIINWLRDERKYQAEKFDYGNEPPKRLEGGLSDGSWFWETGVLNYTGRVRLFSLTTVHGRQALMKVIGTLVHLAELAIVKYGDLPDGGYPSGKLIYQGYTISPPRMKITDNPKNEDGGGLKSQ